MDASGLIDQYGYVALIIGTCFEGEAALLFGGYAARTGHLALPWVLVFGGLGVLVSDWSCFLVGRYLSKPLLRRYPSLAKRTARPLALIERHQNWFIFIFQFIPGSSTVTPIAIGMSHISVWRFLLIDLAGVALWTVIFGVLGYVGGAALGLVIKDLHHYDWLMIFAFLFVGLVIWWRRHSRQRAVKNDSTTL